MSTDTITIKEFLVALGFKTDEAALKKFGDGIDTATKAVFKLAAAVTGTALSVAIGVERFASNLERLYFASQRTGTSATNLKAFSRAAEDFGASADDALSSVEGLTRFLRNNPGGEGQVNSWLGEVGKHLTGDGVKDLESIGELFAKNTRAGQGYLNTQLAGMWGIDEKMMLDLQNGGFAKDLDDITQRLQKAGFNEAAKQAHEFMIQLRDLGDYLVVLGTRVEDALQRKFGVSLKSINEYMAAHGDELTRKIVDGIDRVLSWAEKIKDFLIWLVHQLEDLDRHTDGWSTKILGVLVLLNLVGGGAIIGGVLSLAAAFVTLSSGIAGAAISAAGLGAGGLMSWLGAGTAVAGGALAVGAGATGYGVGWLINKIFPGMASSLGGALFEAVNPNLSAMQILSDLGWSHEQSAGIVANLNRESNMIPDNVGDMGQAYGIAQWHPDRQDAFKKWSGHDIHGSNLQEQLEFVNYELRHGTDAGAREAGMLMHDTDNAMDSAQYFSRYFERPKNADAEAQLRGAAAVHLSAQTTINVSGGDSETLAKKVADKQTRVIADMTRNLQPVAQ